MNLCTKTGVSALYAASYGGHDSTAQLLLNNGADVNLCTESGGSPLDIACQNGHADIVKKLMKTMSKKKAYVVM